MTAQVIAFPTKRRRVEIRALDEELAALRSGIIRAERQAQELEAARDVFEQALAAASEEPGHGA